ncbi:AraC family transcriptional regulator [Ruminococcaceae bacterium OttesenSCG-928-A16]|nr:AraC family transcriptional regulator [Ruminococcaceae bacterium OttesenSCG-928-A16]
MATQNKNRFSGLANYLLFIEEHYNLHVCVKDLCGFVAINKELDTVLQPFLAHTNNFCMYIKHDKSIYHRCLAMIKKMREKSERTHNTYFGMCHAGLGEYVTPIVSRGVVIGTLNAGFFDVGRKRSNHCISRVCRASSQLEEAHALELFESNISEPFIDPNELIPIMEMLADYLALSYENLLDTHDASEHVHRHNTSEDTILSHAGKYIRQNFIHPISISELAESCHCSESYISRIFKKRTNVNITTYINKVRIEASKDFLTRTDSAIADVASNVGFCDPNYYSRVFNKLMGISPREYRRRFSEASTDKLDFF